LSTKLEIVNSYFDCVCIYLENSNQENWINRILSTALQIFNWISDCICIYLEISKQENELICFWAENHTFSIQFLIVFAFIWKIQNKIIELINCLHKIAHFKFNFWLDLHLFGKFKIKKSNQSAVEHKIAHC
jgi:hypothetical protein